MSAPAVGGVSVPHGDGSTVVRLRRGASLMDFAEKINANPASLVTVLIHLGEMATQTQSLDEETFQLLGAELGYQIQVVSPEDEERELLESFDIEFGDEGDEARAVEPGGRRPVGQGTTGSARRGHDRSVARRTQAEPYRRLRSA